MTKARTPRRIVPFRAVSGLRSKSRFQSVKQPAAGLSVSGLDACLNKILSEIDKECWLMHALLRLRRACCQPVKAGEDHPITIRLARLLMTTMILHDIRKMVIDPLPREPGQPRFQALIRGDKHEEEFFIGLEAYFRRNGEDPISRALIETDIISDEALAICFKRLCGIPLVGLTQNQERTFYREAGESRRRHLFSFSFQPICGAKERIIIIKRGGCIGKRGQSRRSS